uniref:WD_REPEATS_REGION domain-containing protein n=1 Tax=Trichuris muris TaxID=70415 RepID=A0A5S6QG36_TRIMR
MEMILIHEMDAMITTIARCAVPMQFAVGLANGSINLVKMDDEEDSLKVTFSGHKSAVTCVAFDENGLTIASGGKDGVVILWDVVSEAGLFRLRGHKGPITKCFFVPRRETLITSSKDSTLKLWNIQCQHCFYTLSACNSEVWSFTLSNSCTQLIVGTAESQLKVYDLEWLEGEKELSCIAAEKFSASEGVGEAEMNPYVKCKLFGSVFRHAKGRVIDLEFSPDGKLLFCSSTGKYIDVYRAYTPDEAAVRLRKKLNSVKKASNGVIPEHMKELVAKDITVRYVHLCQCSLSSKFKSFDIRSGRSDSLYVLVLLNDNRFEEWCCSTASPSEPSFKLRTSDVIYGHRTPIRTARFSNNNECFLSGSAECVKLWVSSGMNCVRTFLIENVLSSHFVPGDRHLVVGTKEGMLVLLDIAGGERLQEIKAHDGAIWNVALTPDQKEIASCSADHSVKFFRFSLNTSSNGGLLTLVHSRTLVVNDDVMCMCFSPNGSYLAVGLLDNTAKVYFLDSFKFFLCLYGHSLPILAADICADSKLIVTGSADKSVKIWGLDFGDCHRSLLAHDDSVTCVKFVPNSHLFFSAGKDGKIKQWCADKFVKITVLDGHLAEIWSLDISSTGNYLLSASHDYSIRMWERTEELLVLQEEEDLERELAQTNAIENLDDVVPGEIQGEAALAAKRTPEVIRNADDIIEAVDICKQELVKASIGESDVHPLLKAFGSPPLECFMVDVLRRVPSSNLEKSLVMLPADHVLDLLQLFSKALERNYEIETVMRCSAFLIRVHYCQLMNSARAVPVVQRLCKICPVKLALARDTVGVNLAAMKLLEKELEEREQVSIFSEVLGRLSEDKKKKRKSIKSAVLMKL